MDIRHQETPKRGSFFIEDQGRRTAELLYRLDDNEKINIYHTEVDESLRGKGVGVDLVKAAVGIAREKRRKIFATCPFAKKVIDGRPEFADVRADEK